MLIWATEAKYLWKGEERTSAGARKRAAGDWSLMLTSANSYSAVVYRVLGWPAYRHTGLQREHTQLTHMCRGTASSTWSANLPFKDTKVLGLLQEEVGQSYRQMAVWTRHAASREGLRAQCEQGLV